MKQTISEDSLHALLSGSEAGSTLTVPKKHRQNLFAVLKITAILSPVYGCIMGGFGWIAGFRGFADQWLQMIYSALKMPLLLLATMAIALPAFFVFNSIAGLRDDFFEAMHSIISSLAIFSIAIVSLTPLTLLFYFSVPADQEAYRIAVLFNALIFSLASVASSISLARSYQNLTMLNPNHRLMFWVWVFLFAFVGIQLGWTLRPFIGSPSQVTTFFREESFTSAYLQLLKIIRSIIV